MHALLLLFAATDEDAVPESVSGLVIDGAAGVLDTAMRTPEVPDKSVVEIEYNFGKSKRYRKETFCYGPKSCPLYDTGPDRPVPYINDTPSMDTG